MPTQATGNWYEVSNRDMDWLKEVDGYNLSYIREDDQAALVGQQRVHGPERNAGIDVLEDVVAGLQGGWGIRSAAVFFAIFQACSSIASVRTSTATPRATTAPHPTSQ